MTFLSKEAVFAAFTYTSARWQEAGVIAGDYNDNQLLFEEFAFSDHRAVQYVDSGEQVEVSSDDDFTALVVKVFSTAYDREKIREAFASDQFAEVQRVLESLNVNSPPEQLRAGLQAAVLKLRSLSPGGTTGRSQTSVRCVDQLTFIAAVKDVGDRNPQGRLKASEAMRGAFRTEIGHKKDAQQQDGAKLGGAVDKFCNAINANKRDDLESSSSVFFESLTFQQRKKALKAYNKTPQSDTVQFKERVQETQRRTKMQLEHEIEAVRQNLNPFDKTFTHLKTQFDASNVKLKSETGKLLRDLVKKEKELEDDGTLDATTMFQKAFDTRLKRYKNNKKMLEIALLNQQIALLPKRGRLEQPLLYARTAIQKELDFTTKISKFGANVRATDLLCAVIVSICVALCSILGILIGTFLAPATVGASVVIGAGAGAVVGAKLGILIYGFDSFNVDNSEVESHLEMLKERQKYIYESSAEVDKKSGVARNLVLQRGPASSSPAKLN